MLKGGGKQLLEQLNLKDVFNYNYLKISKCFEVKNIDDAANFDEVCECLKVNLFVIYFR